MRKTIALLTALLLLFAAGGCQPQPKSLQRTDYLLDTVVTLTLYDATEADLDAAFGSAIFWTPTPPSAILGGCRPPPG